MCILRCRCNKLSCLSNAAWQCSDATFSPQLRAAATDNSVTCAAAVETESSHKLIKRHGIQRSHISVATSQCGPLGQHALYFKLKTHISITVALRRPSAHVSSRLASPLMHELCQRRLFTMSYLRHTALKLWWH